MMHRIVLLLLLLRLADSSYAQVPVVQAKPTEAQLRWHDMGFYLFIHFGPNTFTNKEWGLGDEPESVFNPTQADCRQWCRVAKQAGAKGIIITAKHHDGFCLWPSAFSKHTVRESKWKNGKGDILRDLAAACRATGLKMGVYLSPWDRNHPLYGTPEYNQVFINMMKEIFTRYGPLFEFWWDGANGEGPNGKQQVYDFAAFERYVRAVSPQTVVFSDIGPQLRWVGNERGEAGKTNWNYLDTAGFGRGATAPPVDTLNTGNRYGRHWLPAECDVSIRPGWFYHAEEDQKVKTPEQLFQLWLHSVGRGSNLLLNVPPDRRGMIHENEIAALNGFKKLREENFGNNLLTKAGMHLLVAGKSLPAAQLTHRAQKLPQLIGAKNTVLEISFKTPATLNCLLLKEYLRDGQKVAAFEVTLHSGEQSETLSYTTIGHERIISFPAKKCSRITIRFFSDSRQVKIREVAGYLMADSLVSKE